MEIDLKTIKKIVAERFNIDIEKRTRKTNYIKARCIFFDLACIYTNNNLSVIGGFLKGRDHATVIHARKRIEAFRDEKFISDYNYCKKLVKSIVKPLTGEDLKNQRKTESLEKEIIELKKEVAKCYELIYKDITHHKEINELLLLEDEQIRFACETRLKPFLLMQKSKVTNKDLINKQKLTRTM